MSALTRAMLNALIALAILGGLYALSLVAGEVFAAFAGAVMFVVFLISLAVMGVRRVFSDGLRGVRHLLEIPVQERYESAAAFRADIETPDASSDDLGRSAERIRRLKKAAHSLRSLRMVTAVERIAQAATVLLEQAGRSKAAARTHRPLLVHHLNHVEVVTLGFFEMEEASRIEPDLAERAVETLTRVAEGFETAWQRPSDSHQFEVETRLTALEQQLSQLR